MATLRPDGARRSHLVGGVEGVAQRAALVEHHPQSPHVRLVVVRGALTQLRGQIVGRAYERVGEIRARTQNLQRKE